MSIQRPPHESWDCMLPGPPSHNNGGSVDVSPSGLLAYAVGSSVAVLDCAPCNSSPLSPSLLPPAPPLHPPINPLSPFVTSVRWSPDSLRRDLLSHDPSSTSHILLAVGDRQGRIALRLKSPLLFLESYPMSGIQDLCWVQTRPDYWILAALSGPSLLSLYNTSTGRCFYKYDAASEFFSCIRRDPFDSRHFCALGLKGFLLSVMVLGDTENDVVIKELQISTDTSELQRLEREAATGGGVSNTSSPALATLPTHTA